MALKVSRREVGNWKKKAMSARKRLQNVSKKTDKVVEQVVHTAEVGSAAFVAGVVQGRTGGIEVLGVPLDLGLAASLHGLAFLGIGGKASGHLHGFGDGFLAAFLTTTGRGVGVTMKEKMPAAATKGHLPSSRPSQAAFLTDSDRRMAAMANAI